MGLVSPPLKVFKLNVAETKLLEYPLSARLSVLKPFLSFIVPSFTTTHSLEKKKRTTKDAGVVHWVEEVTHVL